MPLFEPKKTPKQLSHKKAAGISARFRSTSPLELALKSIAEATGVWGKEKAALLEEMRSFENWVNDEKKRGHAEIASVEEQLGIKKTELHSTTESIAGIRKEIEERMQFLQIWKEQLADKEHQLALISGVLEDKNRATATAIENLENQERVLQTERDNHNESLRLRLSEIEGKEALLERELQNARNVRAEAVAANLEAQNALASAQQLSSQLEEKEKRLVELDNSISERIKAVRADESRLKAYAKRAS